MADTSFIIWVQQFSTPLLDNVFQALTFLGDEEYYILTIPMFFWLFSKKFAMRFAIFFLLNTYLNSILKHTFDVSRPPMELRKVEASGYSFPSGHAQGNTSFWGYLAVQINRPWTYVVAAVLFSLVAFSRVYLGVHFPRDIIVGIMVGLAWIGLYENINRRVKLELTRSQWMLASLALSALLLIIPPAGDGPLMGFLLGALWGYRLEADFVGFKERGHWWQSIIKVSVGLAVLYNLYFVKTQLIMPLFDPASGLTDEVASFLLYLIMGLWVTLGAPWLFKALGLERDIQVSV